ncbi:DUF4054 domain-containing protein [Listeria seeligeri]|uniref:DUF4054 domain-containing protein n=1 Tax=Listeria seeligeri TaxID=1640 RepID=UPI00162906E2|nr:DUF4054 domain-containing protein [Listeria seeligeri]MBC1722254.1 DUF4054 domain-containing protein [Listeria seeligeri]MBF2435781.1 DUF4054 domain-containing protein [Listeria seeligeri]
MAKTTISKLKVTAKSIANLSDEALTIFVDDAYIQVQSAGFPEKYEDIANRYLAAHLASLDDKYVKVEAVGSLKREYSGKNESFINLKSTSYGQEYLRLLTEYAGGGNGITLVVV